MTLKNIEQFNRYEQNSTEKYPKIHKSRLDLWGFMQPWKTLYEKPETFPKAIPEVMAEVLLKLLPKVLSKAMSKTLAKVLSHVMIHFHK